MAVERRENVQVSNNGDYARKQRVVEYRPSTQSVLVSRISKVMWILTIAVSLLLAARFILRLVAANAANGFVDFVYSVTDGLVAPFTGIVTSPVLSEQSIIDVPAFIAIIVYALVVWLFVLLFRTIFSDTRVQRNIETIEQH